MAESLLLALLETPQNSELQEPGESNLRDMYNEWIAGKPERQELMLRLLYEVLHHSVMMGAEASTLGTVLARIMRQDMAQEKPRQELESYAKRLRAHMKKEIESHLRRLIG